jgi:hypothetical protein
MTLIQGGSSDDGRPGRETVRRREFIALMGARVTWPFAALVQQKGRTYRLGCRLLSRVPVGRHYASRVMR